MFLSLQPEKYIQELILQYFFNSIDRNSKIPAQTTNLLNFTMTSDIVRESNTNPSTSLST